MNKKNNLAFLTLIVAVLFGTLYLFAQNKVAIKTEQSTKTCSGEKFIMPASIMVSNAFGDFMKVTLLPIGERRAVFSKFTNEQRASFIKVNLALQLVRVRI